MAKYKLCVRVARLWLTVDVVENYMIGFIRASVLLQFRCKAESLEALLHIPLEDKDGLVRVK